MGEESIQEMSDSMWIVDPIDGTTNFCNLHQDYTISVAYYEKYQPVFGVIYDVVQDILYVGIHGSGAYINGTKVEFNKKEVCISNSIMDASIHTLLSNPSLIDLSHKMRGHRSYGCATLGIIYVALQKIDMYVSSHCKVWDYAAAAIFLHELGGTWEMEHDFFSVTFNPCVFVRDPEMLHWIKK